MLLKHNYKKLGSWPLAITAYNHGVAGISRAVRKVRTKNFDKIIENYKSRTFGFASRNFYAEFLAARKIYNMRFAKTNRGNPNKNILPVKLPRRLTVHQLLKKIPIDKSTLKYYNPCLSRKAFTRYKHRPLPRGYNILVPATLETRVMEALNKTPRRKG